MSILVQRSFTFITSFLVNFLEEHLKALGGDNWWQNYVVNNLSVSQRGMVATRRITKLGALDTAAILRVFDKNWFELKDRAFLPWELKALILEILDARNNRSHSGVIDDDFNSEDLYRFIDTVHRSLKLLRAKDFILEEVFSDKMKAFVELSNEILPSPPIVDTMGAQVVNNNIAFKFDDIINKTIVVEPEFKEEKVLATIKGFTIMEPVSQMAIELKNFKGQRRPATMVPWHVVSNNLKFTIALVMIDEVKPGTNSEVANEGDEDLISEFQVYCDSRHDSPQAWDEIVKRLRIGIRLLDENFFVMDLRVATRSSPDKRPTRKNFDLNELSKLVGMDAKSCLVSYGGPETQVGTRDELFGETNRYRNNLAVKFPADNQVVPVVAFLITTILPLLD